MELDELVELMKVKRAKPGRSLYDHSLGVQRIAERLLRRIPHDSALDECIYGIELDYDPETGLREE